MREGGSGFEGKVERRKKNRERDRKFVLAALCELCKIR